MDGFELIPEVISETTERELVERIKEALDGIPESGYGKAERSRVKRYGYDYVPKLRMLEPIPEWVKFEQPFRWPGIQVNSVTINEYQPGHGITPHIDASYFGPVIAILSLGGSTVMLFRTAPFAYDRAIPPRSLTILTGDARYKWTHEILPKSVIETRYSIVFRERLLK